MDETEDDVHNEEVSDDEEETSESEGIMDMTNPPKEKNDEEAEDTDVYLSPVGNVTANSRKSSSRASSVASHHSHIETVEEVVIEETLEQQKTEDIAIQSTMRRITRRAASAISNISPNRIAAQAALRRSKALMVAKKRQMINDEKKEAAGSLQENNEPLNTSGRLSNEPTPVVSPDHRAVTPPLSTLVEERDKTPTGPPTEEPPARMTRARSATSTPSTSMPIYQSETLDTSYYKKRTRLTEVEKLALDRPKSPSELSVASEAGISTRSSLRLRHLSGSSESAVTSTATGETRSTRYGRRRRNDPSPAPSLDATGSVANSESGEKFTRRRSTRLSMSSQQNNDDGVEPVVTALPPKGNKFHLASASETSISTRGRKRTQSQCSETSSLKDHGMVTPVSSPKRRARNISQTSVSVGKQSTSESQETNTRSLRSAPSSPSRHTRRSTHEEQAQQLASALNQITDSPAYHTRHSKVSNSRTSSVHEEEINASPTGSTSSRRSTRSTRSKTAAQNR